MLPLVSKKEETPGQTQDTRERLHLPLGLGTPQHPPRGQGGSSQGGWSGAPVFAAEYRIRWNDLGGHVLISLAEESSGLLSLTNNWMRTFFGVFFAPQFHSMALPPPPPLHHSLCRPGKPQRMFNVYPRIVLAARLLEAFGVNKNPNDKRNK